MRRRQRRKSEDLIVEGRVSVNGTQITTLGTKVDPTTDRVEVDGKQIQPPNHVVYMFNKPKGVITSMQDPHGRPTVAQYLPPESHNVKPVGRLDQDTEGLLLFTNDGDLAFRLTHPRHGVDKEYKATVRGVPDLRALDKLRNGVHVDGRKTAPAKVEIISRSDKGRQAVLKIIVHEGRKRQIRLMCEAVGHPVKNLKRLRFGHLKLTKLEPGQMRLLSKVEVDRLKKEVGL